MSDREDIETPASVPTAQGEWIITLNGRVTRESKLRLPHPELPVEGQVSANTTLDDSPAVVVVRFDTGGISKVEVNHLFVTSGGELTYELTREECDEPGQRWTSSSYDPEATVEILPPSEVGVDL